MIFLKDLVCNNGKVVGVVDERGVAVPYFGDELRKG